MAEQDKDKKKDKKDEKTLLKQFSNRKNLQVPAFMLQKEKKKKDDKGQSW